MARALDAVVRCLPYFGPQHYGLVAQALARMEYRPQASYRRKCASFRVCIDCAVSLRAAPERLQVVVEAAARVCVCMYPWYICIAKARARLTQTPSCFQT